jgi:tetratricopeptide (TPR) repeat protein
VIRVVQVQRAGWFSFSAPGTVQAWKYYKAHDFETAKRLLQESLKFNDLDPESHSFFSAVLAENGDTEEALVEFRRYLELAPPSEINSKLLDSAEKVDSVRHGAR